MRLFCTHISSTNYFAEARRVPKKKVVDKNLTTNTLFSSALPVSRQTDVTEHAQKATIYLRLLANYLHGAILS